jgi:hypothetical protein
VHRHERENSLDENLFAGFRAWSRRRLRLSLGTTGSFNQLAPSYAILACFRALPPASRGSPFRFRPVADIAELSARRVAEVQKFQ